MTMTWLWRTVFLLSEPVFENSGERTDMKMKIQIIMVLASLSALWALAACGGGGGGNVDVLFFAGDDTASSN